jgi:hypothetical protein
MVKKIILFFIIFLFLFIFANFALAACPPGLVEVQVDGIKCVRPLEIIYPEIAGEQLTETIVVSEGLPAYVKYIFHLAVGVIGFVIFGVLIYNGIRYLTSAGNPEKMADARNGILCAFLGGLLLLCSFLIFKTINPQLAILTLPKIKPPEQVVVPGVYICDYKVDKGELENALDGYINKSGEEQIEATKKLREIMWKPETRNGCPRVNASGNFQNFTVTKDGNTIFIVPSIFIDKDTKKRTPKYEYGIILHEKENFDGRCDYYPKEDGNNEIYHQIEDFSAKDLNFNARSVTLFQKPSEEPAGDGVTLYSCFNYNREVDKSGQCDGIVAINKSFQPGAGDIIKISETELGVSSANTLKDNTRSISFRPKGSYLALLYDNPDPNQVKRCTCLYHNYPNLYDVLPKTGDCATGPFAWFWNLFTIGKCKPLLGSMIVIKGGRL